MSRSLGHQSKGERTRQRIVERAAVLFNTRGVAGASMADISEVTGLEKGGVYNHFATKEELALAAFDYAAGMVRTKIEGAMVSQTTCLGRLRAFLDVYRQSARPFIAGGCPLMNTAIEADDTNPELRRRARAALEYWIASFDAILTAGVASGEIRPVDTRATATTILATIEGAVMLALVYGERAPMRAAVEHLDAFLETLALHRRAART